MDAFFLTVFAVALAEMGDRTQLLVLLLAARFRKPLPIILGIILATLLNHGTAGFLGVMLSNLMSGEMFRWLMSLSFIGMGIWMLTPDKQEDNPKLIGQYGAFVTTLVSFFLCEIGDKAQVAAALLAAQFTNLLPVLLGSTLGMLIANVPVVLLGSYATQRLPIDWIRLVASGLFILMGIVVFFDEYPV
jgi:putative Ca2+/H+ antiporter (TMEM165/GDT1 family)